MLTVDAVPEPALPCEAMPELVLAAAEFVNVPDPEDPEREVAAPGVDENFVCEEMSVVSPRKSDTAPVTAHLRMACTRRRRAWRRSATSRALSARGL